MLVETSVKSHWQCLRASGMTTLEPVNSEGGLCPRAGSSFVQVWPWKTGQWPVGSVTWSGTSNYVLYHKFSEFGSSSSKCLHTCDRRSPSLWRLQVTAIRDCPEGRAQNHPRHVLVGVAERVGTPARSPVPGSQLRQAPSDTVAQASPASASDQHPP